MPPELSPTELHEGALAAMNAGLAEAPNPPDPDDDVPAVAAEEAEVEEAPEVAEPEGDAEVPAVAEEAEEVAEVVEEATPVDEALGVADEAGIKSKRSREVFKEAYDGNKEYQRFKAEELPVLKERSERYQGFVDIFEQNTIKPEDFGLFVGLMAAINKGGPADWEKAVKELDNQKAALLTRLGRSPDVDPVAAHPDLKDALESGDVTPQLAREIAEKRNFERLNTTHAQQVTQQQTQAQQQQQQAVESAKADLNELGAHLQSIDPQYPEKVSQALTDFAAVRDTIAPARWALEFRKVYDRVKLAAPAAKPPPTNVPLRSAGSSPGGVARVASSPMDALDMALDAHRRGERV